LARLHWCADAARLRRERTDSQPDVCRDGAVCRDFASIARRRSRRLEAQSISSLDFYHFDFYRFADPVEFSSAGFREQFGPGRICAIEWPERAGDRLPRADLTITLQVQGDGRTATLEAASTLGHACLENALKEFDTTAAD